MLFKETRICGNSRCVVEQNECLHKAQAAYVLGVKHSHEKEDQKRLCANMSRAIGKAKVYACCRCVMVLMYPMLSKVVEKAGTKDTVRALCKS